MKTSLVFLYNKEQLLQFIETKINVFIQIINNVYMFVYLSGHNVQIKRERLNLKIIFS